MKEIEGRRKNACNEDEEREERKKEMRKLKKLPRKWRQTDERHSMR